jgi:hypothetical protein
MILAQAPSAPAPGPITAPLAVARWLPLVVLPVAAQAALLLCLAASQAQAALYEATNELVTGQAASRALQRLHKGIATGSSARSMLSKAVRAGLDRARGHYASGVGFEDVGVDEGELAQAVARLAAAVNSLLHARNTMSKVERARVPIPAPAAAQPQPQPAAEAVAAGAEAAAVGAELCGWLERQRGRWQTHLRVLAAADADVGLAEALGLADDGPAGDDDDEEAIAEHSLLMARARLDAVELCYPPPPPVTAAYSAATVADVARLLELEDRWERRVTEIHAASAACGTVAGRVLGQRLHDIPALRPLRAGAASASHLLPYGQQQDPARAPSALAAGFLLAPRLRLDRELAAAAACLADCLVTAASASATRYHAHLHDLNGRLMEAVLEGRDSPHALAADDAAVPASPGLVSAEMRQLFGAASYCFASDPATLRRVVARCLATLDPQLEAIVSAPGLHRAAAAAVLRDLAELLQLCAECLRQQDLRYADLAPDDADDDAPAPAAHGAPGSSRRVGLLLGLERGPCGDRVDAYASMWANQSAAHAGLSYGREGPSREGWTVEQHLTANTRTHWPAFAQDLPPVLRHFLEAISPAAHAVAADAPSPGAPYSPLLHALSSRVPRALAVMVVAVMPPGSQSAMQAALQRVEALSSAVGVDEAIQLGKPSSEDISVSDAINSVQSSSLTAAKAAYLLDNWGIRVPLRDAAAMLQLHIREGVDRGASAARSQEVVPPQQVEEDDEELDLEAIFNGVE